MKKRPTIKALAPWFGGKRTLAPAIVHELGPHREYYELCCGAMSVLLLKKKCRKETVCDKHGDLINLARVVQRRATAEILYDRLQRTIYSEDLLKIAQHELDDMSALSLLVHHKGPDCPHSIERAYWYFLACWMGRNGTAGTRRVDYQIAVRWKRSSGAAIQRWRNVVRSLPWWHRRLLNVTILCRDMFFVVDNIEDLPGAAVYVDPPYAAESRNGYRAGLGSDHKYQYEFEHESPLFGDDHVRLRDKLARFKRARVVVSYYDCPRIRELYQGWRIVEHDRALCLRNLGGAASSVAHEVLIVNGDAYPEAAA